MSLRQEVLWRADPFKKQFRSLAKKLHPDHGGSTSDFIEMQRSYQRALQRSGGGA